MASNNNSMTPADGGAACQHRSRIKAAGIVVCFDCGMPLNRKARDIATLAERAK